MAHEPDGVIDFGATPFTTVSTTGDARIDGLLYGYKWSDLQISYSFTDSLSDYSYLDEAWTHSSFTAKQEAAAAYWLDNIASVSGLSFVELDGASGALDEDQEATLKFANTDTATAPTAFAYLPTSHSAGGDLWFGGTGDDPDLGDFDFATVGHELGHALGLKHGHESPTLPAATDSAEYSIMTYRSFVGHDLATYPYDTTYPGHSPQSLMMYDIAALQHMYGADFTSNSGNTTYTFSTTTGEMFINGAGVGAPQQNVIFRTVWDGDGVDTYDLSNYATNLNIDLTPGGHSDFNVGGNNQRADLGFFGPGAGVEMARGHLFNALQYNGDVRSLIENAIGGSGNDTLTGNLANNTLNGGAGIDSLFGGDGNDDLNGGAGIDLILNGQAGDDVIRISGTDEGANIDGGADTDTLDLSGFTGGGYEVDLAAGTTRKSGLVPTQTIANVENITGTDNDDILIGDDTANVIDGGGGNDTIDGAKGADTLRGGAGNDTITGGGAKDTIEGGSGNDTINGKLGDDTINGDAGDDVIDGSIGNDIIDGGADNDILKGKSGADDLRGGLGDDRLIGGDDNDTMRGDDGADRLFGGDGNDDMDGGDGDDILKGSTGDDDLLDGDGADILQGDAGADSFAFIIDAFTDKLNDYEDGIDTIEIVGGGLTFADLKFIDIAPGEVRIKYAGDKVIVKDGTVDTLTSADFDAGDFLFV